jgi:hypothetical protein
LRDRDITSYRYKVRGYRHHQLHRDRGMETALAIGTDTEGQRHPQLQVQGHRKETSPASCYVIYIRIYVCMLVQAYSTITIHVVL